jgi:hypothetical protein
VYLSCPLEKEKGITITGEQKKQNESTSVPVKIEQMVKLFKTHRCALDFDWGFINSVIVMQTENDVEEKSHGKTPPPGIIVLGPRKIRHAFSARNQQP